jgi:capsular exopolysaccharide synthesis family protein
MTSTISPLRVVPLVSDADSVTISSDVVMLSDPSGATAESIRHLRTRIIAQHLEHGRRVIALCSAARGSGCSFIAANLAVAFAQAGIRVLLLNADMRDAGLDNFFGGIVEGTGLYQYLTSSNMRPDEVTETEVVSNLWFTPSGGVPPNAQELLSTHRFESFMNISMRQFDLVIVDTPPANNYADDQRISSVAGYAILVGRKNKTYTHDMTELSRQMASDRICLVGTVLNDY